LTKSSNTSEHRQLTDHPHGVYSGLISPDGTEVTWWNDPDGGEKGVWMTQPVEGRFEDARPLYIGHEAYSQGIVRSNETTVFGLTLGGNNYQFVKRNGEAIELTDPQHRQNINTVYALSSDERFVAFRNPTPFNSKRGSVELVQLDGTTPIKKFLDDGKTEMAPISFSPDGQYLLLEHERHGSRGLLLWNYLADEEENADQEIVLDLGDSGELANRPNTTGGFDRLVRWSPDGNKLYFVLDHGNKSTLYEYDFAKPGSKPNL
jgi:hypothetical protein